MNLLISAALLIATISSGTLLPTGDGDMLALKKGEVNFVLDEEAQLS